MFFKKSLDRIFSAPSAEKVFFDLLDRMGKKKCRADFSDPEYLVWCIWVLYSETENGGLDQWATNSSGDLYCDTLEYLKSIKVSEAVEILVSLNGLFDGKMVENREVRIDATPDEESPAYHSFERQSEELTDMLRELWDEVFVNAVEHLRVIYGIEKSKSPNQREGRD